MDNRGLIFIPDISGFSRFIAQTEIEHSRLIIQELLETLINANNTDLRISEIEGDAILFYKFGDLPDLEGLYRQVERMFRAFHSNLIAYDLRRYCRCKACASAISLTLKVITHYGEFTGYTVQAFNKLIGNDIIVAHELLKNDIEKHEYWLVTQNVLGRGRPDAFTSWMEWKNGAKQTLSGIVPFHYTMLSQLRSSVAAEPIPETELDDKEKVASLSREYETDIITLFHAAGDFNYRAFWQPSVKSVEEIDHLLPRVGMRCRYMLEDGAVDIYSVHYRYRPDRIEFSETDEDRHSIMRFILEKVDGGRTRLTLEYYLKRGLPDEARSWLMGAESIEGTLGKSMANLVGVLKQIRLPGVA